MDNTWQEYMNEAVRGLLAQPKIRLVISDEHVAATPARVVKAYEEHFWGIHENPSDQLKTSFQEESYDQMVVVAEVEFTSWCAHHLLPFIGNFSFAYIPNKHIVGLSKIPRMIEVLCARPQVQEQLSHQIVTIFQEKVHSHGCGIVMDAIHTCMCVRGVKKRAVTRTTALTGVFKDPGTKSEFIAAAPPIRRLLL